MHHIVFLYKKQIITNIRNLLGRKDISFRDVDGKIGDHKIKLTDNRYLIYRKNVLHITDNPNNIINPLYKYEVKSFCIIQDIEGSIWIGTINNLLRINLKNNSYHTIEVPVVKNDSTKTRVNSLALDKNGFWIGTLAKGLFYKSDEIVSLKIDALVNKTIECLFKQNDSTLWIGTNKGLFKMLYTFKSNKPEIKNIEDYSTNDGLHSNTINDVIYWKEKIYVATNNGISIFNPYESIKSKEVPRININYISVNGEIIKDIDESQKLSYNQQNVKVNYTGIIFNKKNTSNSFYRYKLNEENWNYTNDRNVEYFFLAPGTYSFSVQCQSNDEVWSEVKTINFTISPHYSQLLSFKIGVTSLIVLFLLLLVRRRITTSKEKIVKELQYKESELATLRNQMNPHFVFNSLNTLQDYIFDGNILEANQYIGDFAALMRKSLEFSKKEKINLSEEIHFIESYLKLEKRRYEDKFDYSIKTNLDVKKEKCISYFFNGATSG